LVEHPSADSPVGEEIAPMLRSI
ncbi:MAG: hypothetical protein QOE32_5552, partial [Pseudonocardiales bacterium]|nr:hypothetical protein [Pseudonocardiales bacterium]